jgi:hypothetical protein
MAEIPESGVPEVKAETPVAPQPLPKPTFTEAPVSSTSGPDVETLAEKVAAKLRPDFEKIAQSTKDKRIAKLEKAMGVGDLAELEEMGATIPDPVKWEYRFRQLEQQNVRQESGGTGLQSDGDSVSKVIQETGLDANRPEVLDLLRGQYRNMDHFAREAYALSKRLSTRSAPNLSSAPPVTSDSTPSTEKSPEQLMKEYKAEVAGKRGDVFGVSNIQAKYRKMGLNI